MNLEEQRKDDNSRLRHISGGGLLHAILGLRPRDKAAMMVVPWWSIRENRVKFPEERSAFVLNHQHGHRDVKRANQQSLIEKNGGRCGKDCGLCEDESMYR